MMPRPLYMYILHTAHGVAAFLLPCERGSHCHTASSQGPASALRFNYYVLRAFVAAAAAHAAAAAGARLLFFLLRSMQHMKRLIST